MLTCFTFYNPECDAALGAGKEEAVILDFFRSTWRSLVSQPCTKGDCIVLWIEKGKAHGWLQSSAYDLSDLPVPAAVEEALLRVYAGRRNSSDQAILEAKE